MSLMHKVIIDKRESVSIDGVIDVISFDENTIIAETEHGAVVIKGINLHVENLNVEIGRLEINGITDSLVYQKNAGKSKGSFLNKIFK